MNSDNIPPSDMFGFTMKKCSECADFDRCGMMKIGCIVRIPKDKSHTEMIL